MKIEGLLFVAIPLLLAGSSEPPRADAKALPPGLEQISAGDVSLIYDTKDFAGVKVDKVKKNPILPGDEGVADGESPEHYCFYFKDKRLLPALKQGARYFFPTDSFVCAFPLHDTTVKDFSKSYYGLDSVAHDLHKLLSDHPKNVEKWRDKSKTDIPDFPFNDAGHSFISKFQYLHFQSGTGILMLTQYSNEMLPNPANNEELTLTFQGLTKDGNYYVASRLAITHPSLPKGIDFTDDIIRDMDGKYLRQDAKRLDGLPEKSFRPAMTDLKRMLRSIKVD